MCVKIWIHIMFDIFTSDISTQYETGSSNLNFAENDPNLSESDNCISEVALSVIWQGNRLGAAYYDFDTEYLYLMSDYSEMAPSFILLRSLLKQVQPHCIVTSCKTDKKVLNILNETCIRSSTAFDFSSAPQTCSIVLLPKIDFAYESSRHHLQNLNLSKMPQDMNDDERKIYFSSLVDFTSSCMIKAAGGLLKFLMKKSMNVSSEKITFVMAILSFSLKNIVHIDEYTYRALQIFQDERHPSVYKSTASIKEGLSLYGICNKCKSNIGKKELKQWFHLPTNDINILEERQTAINFFSLPKNIEITRSLQDSLKHIKYLPKIFTRMKTGQASLNDWKTLFKTSYHAVIIGEICRSYSSVLKIFKEIDEAFSIELFRVASLLDKVIDFEEYARQNHFAVKFGVDSEIDKMKRIYNGLPDFMTQVAHEELQELSTEIQQCSVIYLPQLGYLLTIPMTEHMKETKDYSLPNAKFMFVLNDMVHYKSHSTRKLDTLLGDTLCDIYDKETKIMHKLQNMILEMRQVYFSVMKLLAKLDCLIALAVASKEFNWIQPELLENGEFVVLKARHPLQELCVDSFVANDIFSGGTGNKIKILTGPNSSGKSTYLKQVALVAFMAHLGSFVPTKTAKIPLLDSIFSCIQTSETVSINLSSFLISINQLSSCLNYSSANSLVVIDEFGKDTETISGFSLLTSTIKHWFEKGNSSPHIFLATHYLSVNNFLPPSSHISFQTIDMVLNEELVIFYELVEGIASSSYATHLALYAGVPQTIIERINVIVENLKQNLCAPVESFIQNRSLGWYSSIYNKFLNLNDESTDDAVEFVKLLREDFKTLSMADISAE